MMPVEKASASCIWCADGARRCQHRHASVVFVQSVFDQMTISVEELKERVLGFDGEKGVGWGGFDGERSGGERLDEERLGWG